MTARLKRVDCKICGATHTMDKVVLFYCPYCHAFLPDFLELFWIWAIQLTAWTLVGLIFIIFPVSAIEQSPVWQWWLVQWFARILIKIDAWASWLLPWSAPETILLTADGRVRVPSTLYVLVAATVLGASFKIIRVTKYRFLKWLGWIYEKPTDSWIAISTGERSKIGDFLFITMVQSPADTVYQRRYIGLGVLLGLATEFFSIWLCVTFVSPKPGPVWVLPLVGFPLICLAGFVSGAIGHSKLRHVIIGGTLGISFIVILLFWIVAGIARVFPISGPDYTERLQEYVWKAVIPFVVGYGSHYLTFALAARYGRRYPWPWFGKQQDYRQWSVAPRGESEQTPRRQTDYDWLVKYQQAKANVVEAQRELDFAIEQGQSEGAIKKKRQLLDLAHQELRQVERAGFTGQAGKKKREGLPGGGQLASWSTWMVLLFTNLWVIVLPIKLFQKWKGTKVVSIVPATPSSSLPKIWWIGLVVFIVFVGVLPVTQSIKQANNSGTAVSIPDVYDREVDTEPLTSEDIIPDYVDTSVPYEDIHAVVWTETVFALHQAEDDEIGLLVSATDKTNNPVANVIVFAKNRATGSLIEIPATNEHGEVLYTFKADKPTEIGFLQIMFKPPNFWSPKTWVFFKSDKIQWVRVNPGETLAYVIQQPK